MGYFKGLSTNRNFNYRDYVGGRVRPLQNQSNSFLGERTDFAVSRQNVEDVIKKLKTVLSDLPPYKIRAFLEKAAKPVRERAISLAPKSAKPHYRYKTPKLIKGRRAKRGSATEYRIKYHPGNLKKSIRILKFRRAKLAVFVGPKRFYNFGQKEAGRTIATADGYYAQMVYGNAAQFKQRVTGLALSTASRQVVNIAEDLLKKYLRTVKQKTGL